MENFFSPVIPQTKLGSAQGRQDCSLKISKLQKRGNPPRSTLLCTTSPGALPTLPQWFWGRWEKSWLFIYKGARDRIRTRLNGSRGLSPLHRDSSPPQPLHSRERRHARTGQGSQTQADFNDRHYPQTRHGGVGGREVYNALSKHKTFLCCCPADMKAWVLTESWCSRSWRQVLRHRTMDGTQSDEKDAMDVEEHGVEGRVSLCPGLTLPALSSGGPAASRVGLPNPPGVGLA